MRSASEYQDKFFLWGMVLLPIISLTAYVFDAFYYYYTLHTENPSIYEGLFSTIVIVFSYLQYCVPIETKGLLAGYYVFLWILVAVGHVGYILSFYHLGKMFSVIIFVGWLITDALYTSALLYCRVYRQLDHQIEVENKHIFHFISRLEVILAIFIPVFINQDVSTITRDNIAFFLLFDFFSEKYERFDGPWIKSCLYLFVVTVTTSVVFEWLHFRFNTHTFEYIFEVTEIVSAWFCYALIIMQFFPFHFKAQHLRNIVKEVKIINANVINDADEVL